MPPGHAEASLVQPSGITITTAIQLHLYMVDMAPPTVLAEEAFL